MYFPRPNSVSQIYRYLEDGTEWCCMMLHGMVMIENGRVGGVAMVENGMVLYDDGLHGHG